MGKSKGQSKGRARDKWAAQWISNMDFTKPIDSCYQVINVQIKGSVVQFNRPVMGFSSSLYICANQCWPGLPVCCLLGKPLSGPLAGPCEIVRWVTPHALPKTKGKSKSFVQNVISLICALNPVIR